MTYEILVFGALLAGFVALALLFHRMVGRLFRWCFGGEAPIERLGPTRVPGGEAGERLCRRCDYDLRGLASAYCPECGAMFGFDKRMDELGLTQEEIEQIKSKPTARTTAAPPIPDGEP